MEHRVLFTYGNDIKSPHSPEEGEGGGRFREKQRVVGGGEHLKNVQQENI